MASVRAGHDEFWKFLGPYGWSRGYRGADGKPVPRRASSPRSRSRSSSRPGSSAPEDVAAEVQFYRDVLGLEDLRLPQLPGRHLREDRRAADPVHGRGRPAAHVIRRCRSS